jgi:hypothetical protein
MWVHYEKIDIEKFFCFFCFVAVYVDNVVSQTLG